MYMVAYEDNSSYCLAHHGIKGQKWGIRKYQNEDGSLTPEGMKRYGVGEDGKMSKKGMIKRYQDARKASLKEMSSGERFKAGFKNYANMRVADSNDADIREKFGKDMSDEDYKEARSAAKLHETAKMRNIGVAYIGASLASTVGSKVLANIAEEKSSEGARLASSALDSLSNSLMGSGLTFGVLGAVANARQKKYAGTE